MYRETHFIPPDAETNGLKRRAVCGAWVPISAHAASPNCREGCREHAAAERDSRQLTAEDVFGPPPTSYPPQDPPFECTGGHERGTR